MFLTWCSRHISILVHWFTRQFSQFSCSLFSQGCPSSFPLHLSEQVSAPSLSNSSSSEGPIKWQSKHFSHRCRPLSVTNAKLQSNKKCLRQQEPPNSPCGCICRNKSGPYLLWLWGKSAGPLWHHTAPGDTTTQIETDLMEAERRRKNNYSETYNSAGYMWEWLRGINMGTKQYKLLISGYDWRLLWLDSIY